MKMDFQKRVTKEKKALAKWWKQDGTPKNLITFGVVVMACAIVAIGVAISQQLHRSSDVVVTPTTVLASVLRHPLTGEVIAEPIGVLPQVFGVMIENAADAWPLSGIDEAFLVIEAPVEGNIPRYIAFFSEEQDVARIGPVRSAREYYLDWNAELDGIYAHVGGSPEALASIRADGTFDLDQFFQSEYFYRDELTRYAPHNVYTTTENLVQSIDEMREKYSADAPTYDTWRFRDGVSQSDVSSTIAINWSNASWYSIAWAYDPETNVYTRKQGGGTYGADNVVVIETVVRDIPGDDKGRQALETIGSGPMRLFQNGVEIVGTWNKPSAEERLRFFDDAGEEIFMNAGTTWIAVVDTLERVSVLEETTESMQ